MRMSGMDGARALVVDDETTRAVVRRLLEDAGGAVAEAENGEDALRALYAERPDIVVLDIDLATALDGLQVLERIRQLTDVPVVMLSAHDDELEKVRALQAGADDYVTKPFGPQELLARLQAHLRRAGARGAGSHADAPAPVAPYRDAALALDFAHAEATVHSRALELTPPALCPGGGAPSTVARSTSPRASPACSRLSSATPAARSAPSSSSTSPGTT